VSKVFAHHLYLTVGKLPTFELCITRSAGAWERGGAFLFSRLARLHFTTGFPKAIISRSELLRFNPFRAEALIYTLPQVAPVAIISRSELLRFTLSRVANYCVSTPIGVISRSELLRLTRFTPSM
jgi:hypothetical protein